MDKSQHYLRALYECWEAVEAYSSRRMGLLEPMETKDRWVRVMILT